jgi:mannose-6-phosphate isomerase-like protein (cupin superfamily)
MSTQYAADDVRSNLAVAAPTVAVDPSTPIKPSQWIEFLSHPPTEVASGGSRTWLARGATLVIAYTQAVAGDVFTRVGQPDEYAVLQYSDSAPVRVTAGEATEEVREEAFVVVPPGDSAVEVLADGILIRLFSVVADDLREATLNADAYVEPDLRAAPLGAWPDPVDGFRLRIYRLADHPLVAGRFGRIFRTTNMMVNFLAEEPGPRDPLKLSPHYHDDFEQLSLAVRGRFVHHIRYPWGPDSTQWRPDESREIATPSVCVIPPPTVHTTQGVGPHQQLIDLFSPPRVDFSTSGWVVNSADYPAKPGVGIPEGQ